MYCKKGKCCIVFKKPKYNKINKKVHNMKKRKDGRYQKSISINGKRVVFYGKTTSEINEKMLDYKLKMKDGIVFDDLVEEWENYYITTIPETTYKKCGKAIVKRIKERFSGKRIKNIRPANPVIPTTFKKLDIIANSGCIRLF